MNRRAGGETGLDEKTGFLRFILSTVVQPSGQDRRLGVNICKPLKRIMFLLHTRDVTLIYEGEGDGGDTDEEPARPMTTVQDCVPKL